MNGEDHERELDLVGFVFLTFALFGSISGFGIYFLVLFFGGTLLIAVLVSVLLGLMIGFIAARIEAVRRFVEYLLDSVWWF